MTTEGLRAMLTGRDPSRKRSHQFPLDLLLLRNLVNSPGHHDAELASLRLLVPSRAPSMLVRPRSSREVVVNRG
jgi:hypothetical protein